MTDIQSATARFAEKKASTQVLVEAEQLCRKSAEKGSRENIGFIFLDIMESIV